MKTKLILFDFPSLKIEFTMYAYIHESGKHGHRQLICNGFKFSEYYASANGEIIWRCNKMFHCDGRRRNCGARLRTKVINGYEMIKNMNVKHVH